MSTPEQPATPALTRKQIRELRNTGSTPVITDTASGQTPAPAPAAGAASPPPPPVDSVPVAAPPPAVGAAPFPRPSEPAVIAPAPVADAAVDLGVSPLTRRQARQQERIRTASVPVITPEVVAAHAAANGAPAPAFTRPASPQAAAPRPSAFTKPERPLFAAPEDDSSVSTDSGMHALFGIPRESAPEAGAPAPAAATPAPVEAPAEQQEPPATGVAAPAPQLGAPDDAEAVDEVFGVSAVDDAPEPPKSVSPLLGAALLDAGKSREPAPVEFPPSFDQILARTTGSVSVPNTLIVSQAPEVAPLVAPVTATGEVIVTGTFNLPEGLGSTGHARGTADGKEVDATLVDGELPSHSSPTPIAASAAVSTAKAPGDVIKPPAPEKGGKLMMSLAITAGVLALALVGVLILAFATGAL